MFISSYISAGGYILYSTGTAVSKFQDVNLIFAGMIITQLFSVSYMNKIQCSKKGLSMYYMRSHT